jgi:hypothetical protein
VQTNQITISEDKLRIKLEGQLRRVKKSSGVLSHLSIVITCVGVLVSTDFKDTYGITPDMWKTVFFLAAVVFFVLFIISAFHFIFNMVTVDSIVNDIKTPDHSDMKEGFWNRVKVIFYPKKNNDLETEEEEEK